MSFVRTVRPKRHDPKIQRGARFKIIAKRTEKNIAFRSAPCSVEETRPAPSAYFQIDPYLDYGRFLTAEAGILLIYKDIDKRFRHTFWRVLAWSSFTAVEYYYLFSVAPIQNRWVTVAAFVAAAVVNWLIVAKPIEIYRRIEVRQDCMIIDGGDVFWARFMEGGLPSCRPDAERNLVFCGIYGTRFVEYLTIRRFDDNDRMPEVMSAHLQDAMLQLWMMPH